MLVFVLNKYGKPLMPCKPSKARRLLRDGKAKVKSRLPFTIELINGSSGYKQIVSLKVDSGSKVVGCAAVRSDGETLYASEVKTRKDIHKKMTQRASYRRTRRGRKTRYRQARFNNRCKPMGWLTPTLRSKIQTHLKEIAYVKSILPISELIIETASFDIHKITKQEVNGIAYQQGQQKDFYNTKTFVLHRDKHTCQKCNNNKNDTKLNIHHIVFRSDGGTNSPDNLITLCKSCHDKIHSHVKAKEESLKLQKKRKTNTTDAVQVSTVCSYLKKHLQFQETFGYETKLNRETIGLPKAHFIDAMCIGLAEGEVVKMPTHVFKKVSINKGDYQRTKGVRSEQRIPTGKIMGFKKFDRVEYFKTIAFVKGKMATGYAILMDIEGNKLDFGHTPKFDFMKKIGARKTCLTNQITIGSFTSNTISYSVANIEKISLKKKKLRKN